MSTFQFKQFTVDQSSCAMKINTDGVLLGALSETENAGTILDIGTGTGVIALMLAQRFRKAKVDAVEIDVQCAGTARFNFQNSPFSDRLSIYPLSFEAFFETYADRKYDLIVSNPPFFINSLRSQGKERGIAKHTDQFFFTELIECVSKHLSGNGVLYLILPLKTGELVKKIATDRSLHLTSTINIHSFTHSDAHRELLGFNKYGSSESPAKFVIYDTEREYSSQFREALKNFFTIF
jgi:tRNA1Val (adenine37-N6)-methyltransferase